MHSQYLFLSLFVLARVRLHALAERLSIYACMCPNSEIYTFYCRTRGGMEREEEEDTAEVAGNEGQRLLAVESAAGRKDASGRVG